LAATLGVSSAASFATGVALLTSVAAGCTWLAGLQLRALRPTADE
jgi:hypothetical protein